MLLGCTTPSNLPTRWRVVDATSTLTDFTSVLPIALKMGSTLYNYIVRI